MQLSPDITLQKTLKKWSVFFAYCVVIIAVLALTGWQFDIDFLKRPLPKLVSMNPATAVAMLFSAISFLLLTSEKKNGNKKIAGNIFAMLALFIGLLRLLDYALNSGISIDTILFHEKVNRDIIGNLSNRMAPNTSFSFILTGTALLLLNKETAKKRMPAQPIALLIALLALLSLLGYVYQVQAFYGALAYIPMAIHTAICFLFIAMAILFTHPGKGFMQDFSSSLAGSKIARILIPSAILVPLLLGLFRLWGEWSGILPLELGTALLILSIIIIFLILARYIALSLNKRDMLQQATEASRKQSEEKIRESEHAFSTLFYKSPVMKAISEIPTGKYIQVNDSFAGFFGYTKEEMIGKTSVDLNIIANSAERNEILKQIQQQGFARDIETLVTTKDGKPRWVSTNMDSMNLYGRDCFLTAAVDITKRKEAEQVIQQKSEDLAVAKQDIQDFVDSMSTLCAKITTTGRLLLVNKITLQASGLSMQELLNTNFLDGKWWTYDKTVHTRVQNAFAKACSGITVNYDEDIFVFDRVLTINFSLIPILSPDGSVDYIVAEGRDISEKKQLENEIREANITLEKKVQQRTEELERKNKDLEQFAYVASHDLQEPLRTTASIVELFSKKFEGKLDADADKMLSYLLQSSDRMKKLIQDLLDYSRIGRKTDLQEVDCNEMIKNLLTDLNKSIQEVHAVINTGKLPVLNAYPTELKLLFQNLISNAIKFRRKEVTPLITINAKKEKAAWLFSIEDNGIGIDPKYRERIFVIFQRLHTRSEYEGSGIGLAHCKKIVELHGGNIWVESAKDDGCIFNFTIADL